MYDLADAITKDITDAEHREGTRRFLRRALGAALQTGHGTIIAVIKSLGPSLKELFADSVPLSPPLDVAGRVKDYMANPGAEELSALGSASTLIAGILQTDGITVFTTNGNVLAYRVFVSAGHVKKVAGGARVRTFKTLCDAVGAELAAVFYQSHDGNSEFFGGS